MSPFRIGSYRAYEKRGPAQPRPALGGTPSVALKTMPAPDRDKHRGFLSRFGQWSPLTLSHSDPATGEEVWRQSALPGCPA
jgi:hypothetical protein